MTTPDIEYAMRQHLRDANLAGTVGREVHFGIPDLVPTHFVTLALVGGGGSIGTTPLVEPRLSFAAWAPTKKEAGDIARALVDLLSALEEAGIGNGVHVYGASVDLFLWQPAADTSRARYIVDVTITARSTP